MSALASKLKASALMSKLKTSALASKLKAVSPSRRFHTTSRLTNKGSPGFISKDLSDIRLEMRDLKNVVDKKLSDLDNKLTSGFELLQKSFDAYKSSSDLSLAKTQLQWTRYQLGTIALFTCVIARMFFEPEKQKIQVSISEKCADA